VKIKICGITRERDLKAAVEAGADSLGFVVGVPSSARNLTFHEARELIAKAPADVSCVAVTVFSTVWELDRIYEALNPDYVQLHGSLRSFKSTLVPSDRIIKAVDGGSPEALMASLEASKIFRYVLLDTVDSNGLGGTGITHDWIQSRRIRDVIYPSRLILAGGLTPENVCMAAEVVKPYGVDVSSGVERKPGIKDHDKVFEFVRRAKRVK